MSGKALGAEGVKSGGVECGAEERTGLQAKKPDISKMAVNLL